MDATRIMNVDGPFAELYLFSKPGVGFLISVVSRFVEIPYAGNGCQVI
jgi:hypothetical protein